MRMRVYYFRCYRPSSPHRTWSSLLHAGLAFQIWGRSGENCRCYRGRTVMRTDRQTHDQVISYQSGKEFRKGLPTIFCLWKG